MGKTEELKRYQWKLIQEKHRKGYHNEIKRKKIDYFKTKGKFKKYINQTNLKHE